MCDSAYCPHMGYIITNGTLAWSGTSSYTVTNTDTSWGAWNVTYTNSATTSITFRGTQADGAWNEWIASAGYHPQEVQRRLQHQVEQWFETIDPVDPSIGREAMEERRRLRQESLRRQQDANERAEELLLSCLTEEQKAEYDELDQFRVTTASGRVYVITEGYAGNVVSEGWRYCIHGPSDLPHADQMLMQKLLLETDEDGFLRLANRSLNHEAIPVFMAAA